MYLSGFYSQKKSLIETFLTCQNKSIHQIQCPQNHWLIFFFISLQEKLENNKKINEEKESFYKNNEWNSTCLHRRKIITSAAFFLCVCAHKSFEEKKEEDSLESRTQVEKKRYSWKKFQALLWICKNLSKKKTGEVVFAGARKKERKLR